MTKPRVLVVDDSAFARTVLARILRSSNRVDVVGTARDGNDALEKIAELDPDVVTLDLTMPELDGIGVLRALAGRVRPRVLVVSISSVETDLGVEALSLGALAIIQKPTALASDRLNEIADELIEQTLATFHDVQSRPLSTPVASPLAEGGAVELVMIGASTGGPQALTRVIAELPATLPAPVAVVLHIPVEYTTALAERLDKLSPLHVVEATDGMTLEVGTVAIARGGVHLVVERVGTRLVARLRDTPEHAFRPAVDVLFKSGAAAVRAGALGVVLTGMGDDGLAGAHAIRAASGGLVAEHASTCVVYGMPRAVLEAGLGAVAIPLDRIAQEIARRAHK